MLRDNVARKSIYDQATCTFLMLIFVLLLNLIPV